jgi:hypothetical protein
VTQTPGGRRPNLTVGDRVDHQSASTSKFWPYWLGECPGMVADSEILGGIVNYFADLFTSPARELRVKTDDCSTNCEAATRRLCPGQF